MRYPLALGLCLALSTAHASPITPHIAALQTKAAKRYTVESAGHVATAVSLGSVSSPRTRMWDRDATSFVTDSGPVTMEVDVGRRVFSLRRTEVSSDGLRFKRYSEKRYLGGFLRVKGTVDEQMRATPEGGSRTVGVHANERRIRIFNREFRMGRADGTLPRSGPVE